MTEHKALRRAASVVSNYGDPHVSWSIVLDADLNRPVDNVSVERRLASVVSTHRHLGDAPSVQVCSRESAGVVVGNMANAPYVDDQLIRCMVTGDGLRLAVAAHHGVVDGLGLLSLLGIAVNEDLRTSARGIGARRVPRSFYFRAAGRFCEAVMAPPGRFPASSEGQGRGDDDHLESRRVLGKDAFRTLSTAEAVVSTYRRLSGERSRPAVLAVGASGRDPDVSLTPDRQTAFLRLRVKRHQVVEDILRASRPEPDFPPRPAGGGLVPALVERLGPRLGATATVSNLGMILAVPGPTIVSAVRFFPSAAGTAGIAVGSASIGDVTNVTVRGRSRYFAPATVGDIADRVAARLADQ